MRFIENIGEYYSQHFFSDDFPKKVFDKAGYVTQKKDSDGNKTDNHISEINARISPLREKYFRFKNDLLNIQRVKDKIKRTHDFHREVLLALGYINGTPEYNQPVYLNDTEVIPVRYNYSKNGKPYLFIMEMKAMINEGEKDPDGIYNQTWIKEEWEKVFPATWGDIEFRPDVIKDALSELFLLPEADRPVYVIMLAGAKIFLIQYEKWKYDSFLLFDLEELFTETQIPANRDYLALFYALLAKQNFLGSTESLLQTLDEDAHKAAYGVTQNLKKGVIYAVESLANEAIWFKINSAKTNQEKVVIETLMADNKFAKELKDECLNIVYRLLFLFYAEAREDLEILPTKDAVYKKGYSLDMLRDLEFVNLGTDSSRNGHFFSNSLWKLFDYLHNGIKAVNGFEMKPLDSPLFDNKELKHLLGVEFRNIIIQQIIKRLSLSDPGKGKSRGRISYGNLGINQLGSVYESLLAFSGFFAADTLIEVKAAGDPDGKEGTFLVSAKRRDEFTEDEILKDADNTQLDKQLPKGHFVYRLNGRDRKKSASYYTPEVLTQTTVKYTLKGIIDKLKERQEKDPKSKCADEILTLKILEPAMGAAAFQNEVINQLANAYLELKETEVVTNGGKRIVPGNYNDELQKVKAFIAANNVYGVDLNPTAIELGKLSLWLNCMHRNMETPFFAHRVAVGNAVVGCWLKVYDEADIIVEYPKDGTTKQTTTPLPKAWWTKPPKRIGWEKKTLTRKPNQYYHFLLPDDNMLASAGIALIKESLTDAEKKAITKWKSEFKQPLTSTECKRLQKLCVVIDFLLEEHYKQITEIILDTTSVYAVYGKIAPQIAIKGYDDKERLSESRHTRNAPFYRLRMVMDYWCSLWFWDARNIIDLPTRTEWYNELENILGIDLSTLNENAGSAEILEKIKLQSADSSKLFGSENRLQTVTDLRDQHRFFHHELEFLEVFRDNGGFDVIVGNPPWVNIEMDLSGMLSITNPEIEIRNMGAAKVSELAKNIFQLNDKLFNAYKDEFILTESLQSFLGASQNYFLLKGQKNNLYRAIVFNLFSLLSKNGYSGIIHPETIYEDPKAYLLRKELFQHLKYHFHFRNGLSLFEIGHKKSYGINIMAGSPSKPNFFSIVNLYHPKTIDGCFIHSGVGKSGGITKFDIEGKSTWNLDPHKKRVINITEKELKIFAKNFEGDEKLWMGVKLPSIHSNEILNAVNLFSNFGKRIDDFGINIMIGFDEGQAVKNKFLIEKIGVTSYEKWDIVLSGPNFFVNNPINKSANHKGLFDIVDLNKIEDNYLPNCSYHYIKDSDSLIEKFGSYNGFMNINQFRLLVSRMLDSKTERTLQASIISPRVTHLNSSNSISFESESELIELSALFASLVFDFYIRATGATNLTDSVMRNIRMGVSDNFKNQLILRSLLLNSLNNNYESLWSRNWQKNFQIDKWSNNDKRLKSLLNLSQEWNWMIPLRNSFERRWALIEIDVIVSMAVGLSLEALIIIYEVQFPVLQQNEDDTWYDQKGNIIFTCSKGLTGVGVDRPEWDKLTDEISPMQRTLKTGDTYEHTITKSELYQGQKITYYAPFNKCDRVADYKIAWAHFEEVFNYA